MVSKIDYSIKTKPLHSNQWNAATASAVQVSQYVHHYNTQLYGSLLSLCMNKYTCTNSKQWRHTEKHIYLKTTQQFNGSVKEPNKFKNYETEKITRKASEAAEYIELFGSSARDYHARRI